MTCKDCIHYELCLPNSGAYGLKLKLCNKFKPKSRFIELPCNVGDAVYMFDEQHKEIGKTNIYEGEIISFSLQNDGLWFYCLYKCGLTYWHKIEDFGKIVFTKKALAERSEGK